VHMKAILRKIGAANRTQAAIWARDQPPVTELTAGPLTRSTEAAPLLALLEVRG
jgi:hypothetical protein